MKYKVIKHVLLYVSMYLAAPLREDRGIAPRQTRQIIPQTRINRNDPTTKRLGGKSDILGGPTHGSLWGKNL